MTVIGRNQPCPCGSGRKYKMCCGVEDLRRRGHEARARLRIPRSESDLRARLIRELMAFGKSTLSEAEFVAAREQFLGRSAVDFEEVEAEVGAGAADMAELLFFEWLIHDYRGQEGKTLIEDYLEARADTLLEPEREHLERAGRTVLSVYEVASVDPGRGMELSDMFRGESYRVRERSATRTLVQWDVIVVRLIELDGHPVISGGVLPVPRREARELLEYLNDLLEDFREDYPGASRDEFLKACGEWLAEWVIEGWIEPPPLPRLVTFDGDPVVFCRSHYRILDRVALRAALSAAPDLEPEDGDPDAFAWMGDRPEGPADAGGIEVGRLLLGRVEFEGDDLRLETQSESRLARLRAIVAEAAGPSIEHRADTVEDPRKAAGRMRPGSEREPGPDDIPPEARAQLVAEVMTQHYRGWLDDEIPALGGETPREAVKTEAGREQVLDMIKDIEHQVARARQKGEPAWDPSWLREELGLVEE